MHYRTRLGISLIGGLITAICASAENLGGSYVADDEASMTMILKESSDGTITGTLAEPSMSLPISARGGGGGFAGTIGSNGSAQPFTATVRGQQVILEIGAGEDAERITFTRAKAAAPQTAASKPAPAGHRNVVINEQRLSDTDLAQVEQAYRVRIADADNWYDPVLGTKAVRPCGILPRWWRSHRVAEAGAATQGSHGSLAAVVSPTARPARCSCRMAGSSARGSRCKAST